MKGREVQIELLYCDGCPGHAELLDRLPGLLSRAGVDAPIHELRIDSVQAAQRHRFLGSPTLRIDGRDVERFDDGRDDYGIKCRLYPADGSLRRTPPDASITRAAEEACQS